MVIKSEILRHKGFNYKLRITFFYCLHYFVNNSVELTSKITPFALIYLWLILFCSSTPREPFGIWSRAVGTVLAKESDRPPPPDFGMLVNPIWIGYQPYYYLLAPSQIFRPSYGHEFICREKGRCHLCLPAKTSKFDTSMSVWVGCNERVAICIAIALPPPAPAAAAVYFWVLLLHCTKNFTPTITYFFRWDTMRNNGVKAI